MSPNSLIRSTKEMRGWQQTQTLNFPNSRLSTHEYDGHTEKMPKEKQDLVITTPRILKYCVITLKENFLKSCVLLG